MKKVKIKKSFLLIEVLIAITLLSLCLLPFIPKSSSSFLNFKKHAAYIALEEHFEEKICQMREKAYAEGVNWCKDQKKGKISSFDEPFVLSDVGLKGKVKYVLFLERILESKHVGKHVYRFKLAADYRLDQLKKQEHFWFYFTIEL